MSNLDAGKQRLYFLEIDQPFCKLVYGASNEFGTCTAVLGTDGAHKCYNTRATTHVPDRYQPGALTLRFGRKQTGMLQYGNVLPFIVSLSTTPGSVNLAGMDRSASALGQREVVTVTMRDGRHTDHQVDKYRTERKTGAASSPSAPYDPYTQGTFWGKWLARNPYYSGYTCRVRDGFVGQPLEEMRVRHYVIDRIEGPVGGQVKLVAKDLFSRIEVKKAVCPFPSTGELSANIAAAATSATLNPAGIGALEYPSSGYVRIGDEVMAFTRSGDNLTLTRGQFNTVAADHKDDDLVQLCKHINAQLAHNISYDFLTGFTPIGAASIDKPDWDSKSSEMLDLYSTLITTPTPIADLLAELMEQAGFTLVPDVTNGMVKFVPLRATAAAHTVTDREWVVKKSMQVRRQDERRVSEVWVHYGQFDPTKDLEDPNNFHSIYVNADLDAEGEQQYGASAIRRVFSRFIPQFGRQSAERTSDRILAMFRDPPLEAKFAVHASRYGSLPLTGVFALQTADVQNERGEVDTTVLAVTAVKHGETRHDITAQQLAFSATPPGGGEQIIHIENNSLNLNLRTIYDQQFSTPTGAETVRFIIDAGVVVGSNDTASPALRTGSWPVGTTLILENLGRIQGKAGSGGTGAQNADIHGDNGSAGGDALLVERALTIINASGQIFGGGGGGGGGGVDFIVGGGGGGGGGGAGNHAGAGAAGGVQAGGAGNGTGQSGAPGTADAGGAGGAPGFGAGAGSGGAGGGPGLGGAAGGSNQVESLGGAGGAPGRHVSGNAFVTWTSVGDVRGPVS